MLVTNSLAAVGINFHDWPAGYLSLGRTVSAAEAQPGDLDLLRRRRRGHGPHRCLRRQRPGRARWLQRQPTVVFSANVGSGPVFIRVDANSSSQRFAKDPCPMAGVLLL